MFWHEEVQISEQMYTTSAPAMYFTRAFGLFPIGVKKDGHKLVLKWSPWYALYSYAFGIATLVTAYKGFIEDITIPREKSIRIKVTTDIFVDFSDMSAVMLILICGIFITPFKYTTFYEFVNCLNEIDAIIPPTDMQHARKVSFYTMSSLLAGIFTMVVLDTIMYIKTAGERSGKLFIVQTYTPFYVAYQVLLIHDGLMWHLIYCIFRRVKLLNTRLQIDNYKLESTKYYDFLTAHLDSNLGIKSINQVTDIMSKNQKIKGPFQMRKKQTTISNLIVVYGKICDAVELSNKLLGLCRTITIVGLLWSLIVIPYLLIVEIAGSRKDPLYIMMYTLWCLVHYGRLVLLAQPCYSCLEEVKTTKRLISTLLSSKEVDEQYKQQFHEFSITLLHRQFEFTANGLTSIDRALVTSLTGTITTYLVILLQFANVQR